MRYTKVIHIKITETQFNTLQKLRKRKVRVSDFVREAIREKLERESGSLKPRNKVEYCPFSNGTIKM